ncbi:MAG: efflux RND transporter permease subunit [Campylobacterales bacterium]
MRWIENFTYTVLNDKKKQFLVLLGTVVIFLVTIMLIPTEIVLAKMLPSKDSNTFTIYLDMDEDTSVYKTKEVASCIVDELKKEESVVDIETFIGESSPVDIGGLVKGQPMKQGRNIAEIVVNLLSSDDGRDEYSFALVHRLRPVIKESCEVEGSNIKFVEPPAGPPVLASVVAEVYGKPDMIEPISKDVAEVFKNTEGLVDVDVMDDSSFKVYKLAPINEKIAKSGLNVKQVNQILYLGFEGMSVAVQNSKSNFGQIPLFVRVSDGDREMDATLESVKSKLSQLKLMNTQGMLVPLSSVVDIEPTENAKTIFSKNLAQYINVVAETDMVSQVYPLLEAREKLKELLGRNYEVENADMFNLKITDKDSGEIAKIVWDGEMKVSLDTFADLGGAFIAALILIFLLMVVYYKSFALSGIVLLGSFLSIIGVIWGHLLVDIVMTHTFFLTATSLIGYIALIGISSRNSLLLIDFAKALIEKGVEKDRAIAIAVATRTRPILLTAGAIILASTVLINDAVFGGLGVALMFGTVAAVIASLLVVPVLMGKARLS